MGILLNRKEMKYPITAILVVWNLSLVMNSLRHNADISSIFGMAMFLFVSGLMAYFAFYLHPVDAFIVLIGVLILTPPMVLSESLPGIRLDEVFLIFLIIRLWADSPKDLFGVIKPLIKPLALIGGYIFISILHSMFFLGYSPVLRDFFEYIRFGKYALAFIVAAALVRHFSPREIKKISLNFAATAGVLILFCLYQFLGYNNFNLNISAFYTSEVHVLALTYSKRISGTLGDPNSLAFFLGVVIVLLISSRLFSPQQKLGDPKPASIRRYMPAFFGIACFVTLMWSLSRTNILATFICLAYIMFLVFTQSRFKGHLKTILIILGGALVVLIAAFIINPVFVDRMLSGIYIFADKSFMSRIDKWIENFQYIERSPLFGWGPAKEKFASFAPVDNEYLLVLRKYGFLGLGIYLYGFYLIYRESVRAVRRRELYWLGISLRCILILLLLFSFTGGILYHMQLMPLVLIIAASVSGVRRKMEESVDG